MIAVNTTSCPEDYEMVSGMFYGTKDYCTYSTGNYKIGTCQRKKGLYQKSGVDPETFKKFDGQYICIKRDKSTDYHQLALMRDSLTCSADSGCGSATDSSKRFCLKGATKCPPNEILTFLRNQTT